MIPDSILSQVFPEGIATMALGKVGLSLNPMPHTRLADFTKNYTDTYFPTSDQTGRHYIDKIKTLIREDKLATCDSLNSVFHHLLTSDIPESEKSTLRLQAEATVLLVSGTFTTSLAMSMITYHILSDPQVENRLRADLKGAMACYPARDPLWADLEKIPYLEGCIKEVLRQVSLVAVYLLYNEPTY